ncbi:MAG: glycosyltransferase family 2 protein [Proteobacteria bacterium]|nr:glycosyltransferase family 2 protein [Pseudomonadota bacterium]
MHELPFASCMCLTYGRPHLLEEAIKCFLEQDYKGKKELVVFNDLESQELVFDHPEVRVINESKRYPTLGEKRNACVDICRGDLVFVWDDDDIYLPWRLSLTASEIKNHRYFKCNQAWICGNRKITGPAKNLFHSGCAFTKDLFRDVGGYNKMNSGEDNSIEKKFLKRKERPITPLPLDAIYYVYRWKGTNSYHVSAYGIDRRGNNKISSLEKIGKRVSKEIAAQRMPIGKVILNPHFKMDYVSATRERIDHITKKI